MDCRSVTTSQIRNGEIFTGFYYIRSSVCNVSKFSKKYWKLNIEDYSGRMDAYFWSDQIDAPKPGETVWLSGKGRWLGNRLICDLIAILEVSNSEGSGLLLAPFNVPFPEESIQTAKLLDNIEEPSLKALIDRLLADRSFLTSLLTAPASLRHHHAYPGGLIRHTRETMAIVLANSGDLKPIERDILLSAAFLHDLGKAYEYGPNNRLTNRGDLLGHEVTLLEMIAPIMNSIWNINDPIRLALLHFLIAKPAPQWTGIRHPRTMLVNILRFADKSSAEADLENKKYSSSRFQAMLQRHQDSISDNQNQYQTG